MVQNQLKRKSDGRYVGMSILNISKHGGGEYVENEWVVGILNVQYIIII